MADISYQDKQGEGQLLPASSSLATSLARSETLARVRNQEWLLLEHIFLALLDDPDALRVLENCQINIPNLRSDLLAKIGPEATSINMNMAPPKMEEGFHDILSSASLAARQVGQKEISGSNVLAAIISSDKGFSVSSVLERHGLTYNNIIQLLSGNSPKPSVAETFTQDKQTGGQTNIRADLAPFSGRTNQDQLISNQSSQNAKETKKAQQQLDRLNQKLNEQTGNHLSGGQQSFGKRPPSEQPALNEVPGQPEVKDMSVSNYIGSQPPYEQIGNNPPLPQASAQAQTQPQPQPQPQTQRHAQTPIVPNPPIQQVDQPVAKIIGPAGGKQNSPNAQSQNFSPPTQKPLEYVSEYSGRQPQAATAFEQPPSQQEASSPSLSQPVIAQSVTSQSVTSQQMPFPHEGAEQMAPNMPPAFPEYQARGGDQVSMPYQGEPYEKRRYGYTAPPPRQPVSSTGAQSSPHTPAVSRAKKSVAAPNNYISLPGNLVRGEVSEPMPMNVGGPEQVFYQQEQSSGQQMPAHPADLASGHQPQIRPTPNEMQPVQQAGQPQTGSLPVPRPTDASNEEEKFKQIADSIQKGQQGQHLITPRQQFDVQIPKVMRKDKEQIIEVRIPRFTEDEIRAANSRSGRSYLAVNHVTKAFTVHLRGSEDKFLIENRSPSTHWVEHDGSLLEEDDYAIWRWKVVPLKRGSGTIEFTSSVRYVEDEVGVGAEIPLSPMKSYEIKIKPNYKAFFAKVIWALLAIGAGALLMPYASSIIAFAKDTINMII